MCPGVCCDKMAANSKSALVAVRERRSFVIDALSEAFAHDALDMDEFDRRLTLAHQAESVAELDALVEDVLPAEVDEADDQVAETGTNPETALVHRRSEKNSVVAIMGGSERKGSWRVAEKVKAVAVMGGIELDFREAKLAPGRTELKATAIMGGVDIIVPPWLSVECEGWGIFGGFTSMDRAPRELDPDEPVLVIKGRAIFGGVDIKTRLPGESGWQAYKRRKRERKQLRQKAANKLAGNDSKQLPE